MITRSHATQRPRGTLKAIGSGLLAGLSLVVTACAPVADNLADVPNALEPRGPAAAGIADLWWLMFILGTGVFLLVLGIVLYISFIRKHPDADDSIVRDNRGQRWIMLGGIAMPLIVLAIVFGFTVHSLAMLAEAEATEAPLTIEVVGRRWWWEVSYPEHDFTTANELHIPAGEPVQLELRSGDVIHSFWVPQLHGKMDLIPGKTTSLRIQADSPGTYRGECAEFCGLQHAHMQFLVIAQPREDFDAWLGAQQQPAAAPEDDMATRGQQVFLEAGCAYCHAVTGLDASAGSASEVGIGPDLTHLASRRTIGAGMLENNRGNLSGWIVDPQHIKPGVLMPATGIQGDDLQALLAYLDTLR